MKNIAKTALFLLLCFLGGTSPACEKNEHAIIQMPSAKVSTRQTIVKQSNTSVMNNWVDFTRFKY